MSSSTRSWDNLSQHLQKASFLLSLILLTTPAQAIIDTNLNGVSDLWEKTYNSGSLFTNFDPLADSDGDGWNDGTEAISGTDPLDKIAPKGILPLQIIQTPAVYITGPNGDPELLTPAALSITWPTLIGKQYTLLASVDLTAGSWLAIDNDTPRIGTTAPMGNAFPLTQSDGSTPLSMFYRLAINDADSDGDTLTNWEEAQLGTDPFSIDSDQDGIPDNIDPAPLTSATLTNPDGANPPVGSTTNLLGFWDFESQNPPAFPVVFPDHSGNNRHANGITGPQPFGLPSLAGRIGPGTITIPSQTINGSVEYTVTGWFKFGKDTIKNSPTDNFKALYAIYDRSGTGSTPHLAPLGQGTGLFVRKSTTDDEEWFVGGYRQTTHFNEFPHSNGSAKTIFNGHYFNLPEGTSDDDKWHHFAVTSSASSLGQKVYFDGVLTIEKPRLEYTVSHDPNPPPIAAHATTFTFGSLYPGHGPSTFVQAFIDRVRVQSRLVNATEIEGYYRQDIDRDGLWDVTESSTALWRDTNSNGSATPNEFTYSSSPLHWQPTITDTDSDGLTDIYEQSLGTQIENPDSDGDLLPDGWEETYGLNPITPNDPTADTDSDGLTLLDEYRYNTNPNLPNTDGDSQNDGPETAQGSNPNDASDGGNPTPPDQRISILLAIGDRSGSHSEDYVLHCYRLDPQTGQEQRIYTLRSGGYGQYATETQSIFKKGESYTFQIDWQSSNLGYRSASPGVTSEGPDYDYTFKVQPQGSHTGILIDAYDPKTKTIGNPILAENANDVATTEAEFKENYEDKRVAVLNPKLEWVAVDGYDNIDDHIDPWNNTIGGKRIFPDFKDPTTSQIRHAVQLIVSGALPGLPIYVKAFDVDDSTSETFDLDQTGTSPVIDTNGKAGDDNLTDYLNTPKNGQFWTGFAWGTNSFNKTADANGQAKFIFRVGMQPGNNYRVVASVNNNSMYSGVQITNPTSPNYLGPETSQNGDAPASPLLTVWRRLWVENDSMEAVSTYPNGDRTNDLSSDIIDPEISDFFLDSSNLATFLVVPTLSDVSSFSTLENGRVFFQSSVHNVIGTTTFAPTAGNYTAKVAGDQTHFPNGSDFRLYDDDDYGLDSAPLPQLELVNDQMKNYFKPSFVVVVNASAFNPYNLIDLSLNEDVSENNSFTVVDDVLDLTDKNPCWVCPITAAYQGPRNEDQDPRGDGEGFLMGETTGHGEYNSQTYYDHSTVFIETCRENYDGDTALRSIAPGVAAAQPARIRKWITAVMSHEMGHQPGNQADDHPEGGLMGAPMDASLITPENSKFTPQTIKRFRKSERWSK